MFYLSCHHPRPIPQPSIARCHPLSSCPAAPPPVWTPSTHTASNSSSHRLHPPVVASSSLRRWTPSVCPSIPLLSNGAILCVWNHVDLGMLSNPPEGCMWVYAATAGGAQILQHTPSTLCPDDAPLFPYIMGPPCPRCGRPRPQYSIIAPTVTADSYVSPPECCWWSAPNEPLTAMHAAAVSGSPCLTYLDGVLPLQRFRRPQCHPAPPTIWAPDVSVPFLQSYAYAASPTSSPAPDPLRILSINCGGLGAKLHLLLAILDATDPDVVCLQEVGSSTSITLSSCGPYRIWQGTPVPGGGLATLLHPRRFPSSRRPTHVEQQPHLLGISLPLTGGSYLTIVNQCWVTIFLCHDKAWSRGSWSTPSSMGGMILETRYHLNSQLLCLITC